MPTTVNDNECNANVQYSWNLSFNTQRSRPIAQIQDRLLQILKEHNTI